MQEEVWNNKSDTVERTTSQFRIWDTLKLFHPHSNDIRTVVKVLNRIGAKRTMIAAALGLLGWQNLCGISDWTSKDVKDILEGVIFEGDKNTTLQREYYGCQSC